MLTIPWKSDILEFNVFTPTHYPMHSTFQINLSWTTSNPLESTNTCFGSECKTVVQRGTIHWLIGQYLQAQARMQSRLEGRLLASTGTPPARCVIMTTTEPNAGTQTDPWTFAKLEVLIFVQLLVTEGYHVTFWKIFAHSGNTINTILRRESKKTHFYSLQKHHPLIEYMSLTLS